MECYGCNRKDCGSCTNCTDMKKFGGQGKKKQKCIHRVCTGKDRMGNQEENMGNTQQRKQTGNTLASYPGLATHKKENGRVMHRKNGITMHRKENGRAVHRYQHHHHYCLTLSHSEPHQNYMQL